MIDSGEIAPTSKEDVSLPQGELKRLYDRWGRLVSVVGFRLGDDFHDLLEKLPADHPLFKDLGVEQGMNKARQAQLEKRMKFFTNLLPTKVYDESVKLDLENEMENQEHAYGYMQNVTTEHEGEEKRVLVLLKEQLLTFEDVGDENPQ